MKKLLALAIFLRVLVAIFFFHPDIKTYNYQASFLGKGVFDIYTYLIQNQKTLPIKDGFVYFPLTYFALGSYQVAFSPLFGSGFNSWLANTGANSVVENPQIFKYLFLMKLPYLVLDIAIAFILMRFFDDKEQKEKAFVFWLFNPFTIILIYVFSNIDILPVILTVVSFLMIKKKKLFPASILLGLAAGFKLYPLMFIPFLFLSGRNIKEKILLSITPLLTFGIIILPFISKDFFSSALVSGLTTGIFGSVLAVLSLFVLFFYAAFIDKKLDLFNYWLALFLVVFSFITFHIQWLLWLAPFLVILCVKNQKMSLYVIVLSIIAFLVPVLFQDRYMSISLFRVYSTWFDTLSTPYDFVQKFYDPASLQLAIHWLLAGGSLFVSYKLFKKA